MENNDDRENVNEATVENAKNSGDASMVCDNATADGGVVISRWERHRRKRVIRITKKLFRAIDVLYATAQNTCPYIGKKEVKAIYVGTDIVYDEALPKVCRLDFYRKKSGGKQPAIILIHGGGFTAGDKKYRKGRAQYFAINGFCVFCINYGLAPEYVFPEPLKHIVAAMNFIYDNADKYNIDVDRIFVGGDSAGAYYAALIAAFNCSDVLKTGVGVAPKFTIFGTLLNCGIYDLQTIIDAHYPFNLEDGVLLSLMGIKKAELNTYRYRNICVPSEHVARGYPPSFLIYADSDIFCKGQGDVFAETLERCGIYHECYVASSPLSNHCFSLTWRSTDAVTANERLLSFVKRLSDGQI